MCDDSKVIFTEDPIRNNALLNRLPYIFHDPHSMDKKVDVKKLQFGSKIDKSEAKREELFNVKNVIAPDKIKFDAENNLLSYVYLDNKTFINNHLIRTGYVDVDTSFDYIWQKKFLNSIPK